MGKAITYEGRPAVLHINRDGTIRIDGEPVGYVMRVAGGAGARIAEWRAEIGDPVKPETYAFYYAATRKRAVEGVLES